MKKTQRLSRGEFSQVLKKGKRLHSEHLSIIVSPSDRSKCGVVVSKKVAKRATDRNRVRRHIYAVLQKHSPSLQNMSVIVVTKSTLRTVHFSELQSMVADLIEKHFHGNNFPSKVE